MENTIQFQTQKCLDYDSLVLASLILLDVNRVIRDIHTIVSVLLRYAMMGVSISNGLIGLIVPAASEQD